MVNNLDLEEQEQLDQLKFLWRKYGKIVTFAFFSILVIFFSWNMFVFWKKNEIMKSALLYEKIQSEINSNRSEKNLISTLESMKSHFHDSEYTHQSALAIVKYLYAKGDGKEAQNILNWILADGSVAHLENIALLRLTNIYISENLLENFKKINSTKMPKDINYLFRENLGDVEILKKNNDQAYVIYNDLYRNYKDKSNYTNILKVKVDSTFTNN